MSDVRELIDRGAPKGPHFVILLQSGDKLIFAFPEDSGVLGRSKKEAKRAAQEWLTKFRPPAWKDIFVADEDVLTYVHLLAGRSVAVHLFQGIEGEGEERKPKFKIRGPFEHADFLTIAKDWPGAFDGIKTQFDEQIAIKVISYEADAINEAKKDSAPTP